MDRLALRAANLLVGNAEGAAVLEAVFLGPELEFTSAAKVAITGGELPPKLNGDARATWEAFPVKPGDRLSFGYLKSGARVYIAVAGGFDVPLKLGSRSTYTLGALGGLEGRALKAGDRLPVGTDGKCGGSIQVPGGTEPSVLHCDAVSGGGYMMIGTVISADMDLIGQLQPHSPARFVEVTMDQALAARSSETLKAEECA